MKSDLNLLLSYTQKTDSGCMEWTRCFNTDGYPRAVIDGNGNGKVHRIVFELFTGKSATGLVVRHTCDNPKCINPTHLLLGTVAENVADRDSRGRHGKAVLSHEDVRTIRKLYTSGGITQAELSSRYGVSLRNINSLINFKHWRHI